MLIEGMRISLKTIKKKKRKVVNFTKNFIFVVLTYLHEIIGISVFYYRDEVLYATSLQFILAAEYDQ